MLFSESSTLATHHLVEISGWDEDQIFFVERCELFSDHFEGKQISLNRMLTNGSIVFLRFLEQLAAQHSSPLPLAAEPMGSDSHGQHRFRLNDILPRSANPCFPVN